MLLIEAGFNENEINFETIISVVDDLYNYYSSHSFKNASKFLLSQTSLFAEKLRSLFDYKVDKSNTKTGHYSLIIPEEDFWSDNSVPENTSPEQKYCGALMNDLLSGIQGHISKYSAYSKSVTDVIFNDKNLVNNTLFVKWIKSFTDANKCVRLYTLNYDYLFKALLQESSVDIFDGFNLPINDSNYSGYKLPNMVKILTDFDSNVHYNLHGSVYWHIENLNVNDFPRYQYLLKGGVHFSK